MSHASALSDRAAVLRRYIALRIPNLDRDEEIRFVSRAQAGDVAARDLLVRANLGRVIALVARLKLSPAQLEDVIQEGAAGLVEGIARFDLSQPVVFGTYAVWWVKAYVGKYLKRAGSVVRPRAGTSAAYDVSLDEVLVNEQGEESDAERLDFLADPLALSEEQAEAAEHDLRVRQALWRLRRRLGPLGWDVLENRLCGEDKLAEVGKRWSVSRERVRQIEIRVRALLERYLGAAGFGTAPEDPELARLLTVGQPLHDPQTERSSKPREARGPVPEAPLPCCGSRGWRHLKGCPERKAVA